MVDRGTCAGLLLANDAVWVLPDVSVSGQTEADLDSTSSIGGFSKDDIAAAVLQTSRSPPFASDRFPIPRPSRPIPEMICFLWPRASPRAPGFKNPAARPTFPTMVLPDQPAPQTRNPPTSTHLSARLPAAKGVWKSRLLVRQPVGTTGNYNGQPCRSNGRLAERLLIFSGSPERQYRPQSE
jgi:hypothetical protein